MYAYPSQRGGLLGPLAFPAYNPRKAMAAQAQLARRGKRQAHSVRSHFDGQRHKVFRQISASTLTKLRELILKKLTKAYHVLHSNITICIALQLR